MKKKILTGAMALMLSLALFSCDKEHNPLDESLSQKASIKQDKLTNRLYTANSEVLSYAIIQDEKKGDELRASILNFGYQKPTIDVTKAEFEGNSKAHWGIMGNNVATAESVASFLDMVPSKDDMPSDNALVFYKEGSKRLLKMYAYVEDGFDVKNKFAMLSLDGELRDKRYIDFKDATAPNNKLQGVMKNGKLEGYHLPIMTDILPFEKVFENRDKERVHYQSRGVLIGLSIINDRVFDAVNIKRIIFEADNALWFEGSFDMQNATDGTNILGKSSAGVTTIYRAKFEGAKTNEELTYPVDNGGYQIAPITSETINSQVKEEAPVFYIWGYPRNNGKKLKFKIVYTDEGKTEERVKACAIDLSNVNLKEGYAYQLPIILHTTPLDFVTEEFAVNHAGTGFVLNSDLPNTMDINQFKATDVGHYTYQQSLELFANQDWLKNGKYYYPLKEHWQSIFPYLANPNYVLFNQTSSVRNLTELAQIGETATAKNYSSDFITVQEGTLYVTYAIRFKGDKRWQSAWRYSYEDDGKGHKTVIAKSVSLTGSNRNKSLSDIQSLNFFNINYCTTRVFPAYGYRTSDTNIGQLGLRGYYWADTPSHDVRQMFCMTYRNTTARTVQNSASYRFAIRPFRRQ